MSRLFVCDAICQLQYVAEIGQKSDNYFLARATLRGTILSADIELTILSMSTFAGITGAPYGRLRVDPDLFLPFQGGLDGLSCGAFACCVCCAVELPFTNAYAFEGGGGLTEVPFVETVPSLPPLPLLPLLSRLLALCPLPSTPALNILRFPSTPESTTRKS